MKNVREVLIAGKNISVEPSNYLREQWRRFEEIEQCIFLLARLLWVEIAPCSFGECSYPGLR